MKRKIICIVAMLVFMIVCMIFICTSISHDYHTNVSYMPTVNDVEYSEQNTAHLTAQMKNH